MYSYTRPLGSCDLFFSTSFLAVAGIVFTLGTPTASGALVFEDNFDYPVSTLSQANTSSQWSRTGTGDSVEVINGNLTHPTLKESSGNMVQWGGGGRISRRDFDAINSGTVFASMLLRIDDLGLLDTNGGAVAGLVNAANTSNPNSRLYIRRNPNNSNSYNLGIYERGATITWANTQLFTGGPHFVVFSLSFVAGQNNDFASLWIDPSANSFEAGTAPAATAVSSGGEDATQVNRFRLVQNSATGSPGQLSLDELRVGTSWADVTPVPEPSSLSMFALALFGFSLHRRRKE